MPTQTWTVSAEQAGARLDTAVAAKLSMSRSAVRQRLQAGQVTCNGLLTDLHDKGRLLQVGDRIAVEMGRQGVIAQPELALNIVAQGEGWIVVDKPAGMPVHPLRSGERGTILNAVAGRFEHLPGQEGELRRGVVHRLDFEASGVLAIALNDAWWSELRSAFAEHRIEKRYLAVVAGRMQGQGRETMDLYVARHKPALVRVAESQAHSREKSARCCTLEWRAIQTNDRASLLEIDLGTGHLHQIRVMLAHLNHPILGDAIYGQADSAPRLMLHATSLRYGPIAASSPTPTEFAALISA
ncbi:MAG: RluA family pseudouridine synthase [Phycisphaeraceae bacterium]|nr:RluA family pseudouridine synthase [Phycisphaeraceae bacterium]